MSKQQIDPLPPTHTIEGEEVEGYGIWAKDKVSAKRSVAIHTGYAEDELTVKATSLTDPSGGRILNKRFIVRRTN